MVTESGSVKSTEGQPSPPRHPKLTTPSRSIEYEPFVLSLWNRGNLCIVYHYLRFKSIFTIDIRLEIYYYISMITPSTKSGLRINKYLSRHYPITRKQADDLIAKKKVLVNGQPAVLGMTINSNDKVVLSQKILATDYRYFIYHKPAGLETSATTKGVPDIIHSISLPVKAFPIGRLDKQSRGLIILSNDGRLAGALLNPKTKHEKEYVVTTDKTITDEVTRKLAQGVQIEHYRTKKAKVTKTNDKEFKIILTEGKKHQIRRMCVALHNEVRDLKRTRIMNIRLEKLPPGSHRSIGGEELKTFLKSLGL